MQMHKSVNRKVEYIFFKYVNMWDPINEVI